MFTPADTIVAVATPPGRGGIGVVRISGPASPAIAAALRGSTDPLEPRRATLTPVLTGEGPIDRALFTFFPAPHSYTGEDVLEISAHGSPVLLHAILVAAMDAGARLAEPGEFTLRAYLSGRLDLIQAEAVNDLVSAVTPLQARVAFDQLEGTLTQRIAAIDAALLDLSARLEASLDFSEEGYHFVGADGASGEIDRVIASIEDLLRESRRGRLVREGAQVALVGRPNSGKSSLFNRLAGAGRAIVTDVPGTTRDLLTEVVEIGGAPITLIDTAGLRTGAEDAIEQEGMARARSAAQVAGLCVVVLDGARPLTPDDWAVLDATSDRQRLIVANKHDLPAAWAREEVGTEVLAVSAKTGHGFDALRAAIAHALAGVESDRDSPVVSNIRHIDLLTRAQEALQRASIAAADRHPEEFVVVDVTAARQLLEEVTGRRTADDVLQAIFSSFCIGK